MYNNMAYQRLENIIHCKKVVEDITKDLNKTFRQDSSLTTTKGKILEYLNI